MSELTKEIEAYNRLRRELEIDHIGEWVVIHDQVVAGIYGTFEEAAEAAVRKFGRGPYLIRQVGAPDTTPLPASVMYQPV